MTMQHMETLINIQYTIEVRIPDPDDGTMEDLLQPLCSPVNVKLLLLVLYMLAVTRKERRPQNKKIADALVIS
jgi:hypothetical protein